MSEAAAAEAVDGLGLLVLAVAVDVPDRTEPVPTAVEQQPVADRDDVPPARDEDVREGLGLPVLAAAVDVPDRDQPVGGAVEQQPVADRDDVRPARDEDAAE